VWLLFIGATFISQVIIFNMLIAIMGDTYGSITEKQSEAALREKIQILCDYLRVISSSDVKYNYLISLKPGGDGESGSHGFANVINELSKTKDHIVELVKQRFDTVQTEVKALNNLVVERLESVMIGIQLMDEN
jgi:hypothetical protein